MLHLNHVTKRYGALTALDGVSLRVAPGEFFGLLGPNGAGKSTLMSLVAGLRSPDSGTLTVDGSSVASADSAARTALGLVPQHIALYQELSALQNLRIFGQLYGLRGSVLAERVEEALAAVQLNDRRNDQVKTFSGGMQRRLNIACAIVHEPELVLLDEPTVGVDPQSRNAIFDNVLALKARGTTVVYTTHYMEEAERLCDRVGIVDHGKLLALDTPAGLKRLHGGATMLRVRRNGSEQCLETSDPLRDLNRLAAQAPIDEFHLERPTLEQVFLHLTGRSLRD